MRQAEVLLLVAIIIDCDSPKALPDWTTGPRRRLIAWREENKESNAIQCGSRCQDTYD